MERKIILFLLFYHSFLFAQKIQIIDAENLLPIPNARIISQGNIYYTNDEGFSILKENSKNLEIFASGYETLKENNFKAILKLKPTYRDIDEVNIVSVDFQKILKNVADHYSEIYYNKPIIYDVTIKQKSYENNDLKLLMIADGKLWNRDGNYDAKLAYNDKFDKFVQLQIDNLRYLKTQPSQNKVKEKKPKTSHDNIGDMFLNYELWRIHSLSKMKNAKISGRLIYEKGEEQEISYSIKSDSSYIYTGNFIYNKKDHAVTHFELNFTQNKSEPVKYKDIDGNEFYRKLGDGIIMFDYYKSGDKYFPSKISVKAFGSKTITDSQNFEYKFDRDIIFKNFYKTDKDGLEKPVKINLAYWHNLKISEEKGDIILTKEEQNFIDEN